MPGFRLQFDALTMDNRVARLAHTKRRQNLRPIGIGKE
jgi:hypothetical protein